MLLPASQVFASFTTETFLVSLQAWRGVPSHFNVETAFDAAVGHRALNHWRSSHFPPPG